MFLDAYYTFGLIGVSLITSLCFTRSVLGCLLYCGLIGVSLISSLCFTRSVLGCLLYCGLIKVSNVWLHSSISWYERCLFECLCASCCLINIYNVGLLPSILWLEIIFI